MESFKTTNEILDFAIESEQEAADFYDNLAGEAAEKAMRETFERFAREEKGHKARLIKIKDEGVYETTQEAILDMKMSDYLVAGPASGKMSYQDALILAMKREQAAFKWYIKLSELAPTDDLKNIFRKLANDEARHKMNFEVEYDTVIYRGN
jgi:rubrerythrin